MNGNKYELEKRMNLVLKHLGLPLEVRLQPDDKKMNHGTINILEGVIEIYDNNEEEAWKTLQHEIIEFYLDKPNRLLRHTINSLISVIEKHYNEEREQLVEALPRLSIRINEEIGRVKEEPAHKNKPEMEAKR
jgi:hypothetical protein